MGQAVTVPKLSRHGGCIRKHRQTQDPFSTHITPPSLRLYRTYKPGTTGLAGGHGGHLVPFGDHHTHHRPPRPAQTVISGTPSTVPHVIQTGIRTMWCALYGVPGLLGVHWPAANCAQPSQHPARAAGWGGFNGMRRVGTGLHVWFAGQCCCAPFLSRPLLTAVEMGYIGLFLDLFLVSGNLRRFLAMALWCVIVCWFFPSLFFLFLFLSCQPTTGPRMY